jgi:GH18 family chitinase
MLFHLLCWVAVGLPCLLLGSFIKLYSSPAESSSSPDHAIVSLYIGLVLMSSVLLALSLIVPVSPILLALIVISILGLTLSDEHTRQQFTRFHSRLMNRRTLAGMAILLPLAAYGAADRIKVYDTGLYHYPLTRWLATTGTVPGLALLSDNLGFTSSWFALTAALDHGPFHGRVAGIFNGLVTVTAIIHFSGAVSRVIQRRAFKPDWFVLGAYPVVFALCYQVNYYSSLSPDFPAFVLTIIISWWVLMQGYSSMRPDSFRSNLPLLIIASGIVDLKLSALPVLIAVLLLIAVRCQFRPLHVIPAVLTACALVAPLALANVVSSGYPLYPSPILGLRLPWSVSTTAAAKAASVVTNWARCNGPCGQDVAGWSWVVPWLRAPQNALMLLMSAGALILFILQKAWQFGAHVSWVLMLAESGVIYVLLTAPNVRFAAGYIAVCSGLSVALLSSTGEQLPRRSRSSFYYAFIIAVSLELSFLVEPYVRRMGYTKSGAYLQMLLPSSVPSRTNDVAIVKNRRSFREVPLTLASEAGNGFSYLRPVGSDQCWAADIPCVPGGLKPGIVLRDPRLGFGGGFARVDPQTSRVAFSQTLWSMGYWTGANNVPVSSIDWGALTHVAHTSIRANGDGSLTYVCSFGPCSKSQMGTEARALITAAHNHGVKVMPSVGSGSGTSWTGATNSTNLATFVVNIMKVVNAYGYDGVDIDWEGPAYNFTQIGNLFSSLRTALGSKLLSSTVVTTYADVENFAALSTYVDRYEVMSFDKGGNTPTWFNEALSNDPNGYPTLDSATSMSFDVQLLVGAGTPASKINCSLPFYGEVQTGAPGPRQNLPVSVSQINYNKIVANYSSFVGSPNRDSVAKSVWFSPNGSSWVNYDDATSITFKINYAKTNNLGGWFIWALDQDYFPMQTPQHPLLAAVQSAMRTGSSTTPSLTTAPQTK